MFIHLYSSSIIYSKCVYFIIPSVFTPQRSQNSKADSIVNN